MHARWCDAALLTVLIDDEIDGCVQNRCGSFMADSSSGGYQSISPSGQVGDRSKLAIVQIRIYLRKSVSKYKQNVKITLAKRDTRLAAKFARY